MRTKSYKNVSFRLRSSRRAGVGIGRRPDPVDPVRQLVDERVDQPELGRVRDEIGHDADDGRGGDDLQAGHAGERGAGGGDTGVVGVGLRDDVGAEGERAAHAQDADGDRHGELEVMSKHGAGD